MRPSITALGPDIDRNSRLTWFRRCPTWNPQHHSEVGIFCTEPTAFLQCRPEKILEIALVHLFASCFPKSTTCSLKIPTFRDGFAVTRVHSSKSCVLLSY